VSASLRRCCTSAPSRRAMNAICVSARSSNTHKCTPFLPHPALPCPALHGLRVLSPSATAHLACVADLHAETAAARALAVLVRPRRLLVLSAESSCLHVCSTAPGESFKSLRRGATLGRAKVAAAWGRPSGVQSRTGARSRTPVILIQASGVL